MKIIVISNMYPNENDPYYGVFVKNFCELLDSFNIDVEKIVMYKNKNCLIKIVSYISHYVKIMLKLLINDYDVVYVHYGSINSLPIVLVSFVKKLRIYTNLHGSDVESQSILNRALQVFQRRLLKRSVKVVVPSMSFKNKVSKKYNIQLNKIIVYPSGGIDSRIFSNQQVDKIELNKFTIKKDKNINYIGFVSRIVDIKGWEVLIDSVNLLINKFNLKNICVIIVGDGKEYPKLIEKINKYNIEKYIHKINFLEQEDLSKIYNFIDLLVFPSFRESLGLVPIECLACGTAVIASNIDATNEYIYNEIDGYLFEKGNYVELANKIIQYFELDEDKREEMKLNANKIGSSYDRENTLKVLKKIIYEVD